MQLHTRGTWSPREDRRITLLWLGIFLLIVVSGFLSDLPGYFAEVPHPPMIVHVHAVFTSLWLLILTGQVLLVEVDNVKLHRRLGWFAVAWAAMLWVLAAWGEFAYQAVLLKALGQTTGIFAIALANLLCFAILMPWAIMQRKNSAVHRRLIILANLAIFAPGSARFLRNFFHLQPTSPLLSFFLFYGGSLFVLLLMLLWDIKKNRVLNQFVMASVLLLCIQIVSVYLLFLPEWKSVANDWVSACGKYLL